MIVGHERTVSAWEKQTPLTCLLIGPDSVGKFTAAQYMAREVYNMPFVLPYGSETAYAGDYCQIVHASDYAHAQRVLDTSGSAVFVIAEDDTPLKFSVEQVYHFGLLSEHEVIDVLSQRSLVPALSVSDCAAHSHGQIKNALRHYKTNDSRQVLLNVLKATRTGDLNLLTHSLRGLPSIYPVVTWWVEATTQQWNVYSEEESWECHTSKELMRDIENSLHLVSQGCRVFAAGWLAFGPTCERMSR